MGTVIRPLRADDSVSEITELLHAAYAPLAQRGFHHTAATQTDAVTRERINHHECFLAFDGRRIVGTLVFHDAVHAGGCAWYDRPDVAVFHQLAVLPTFQRRGIGSALVASAERRARETGALNLALDTAEGTPDLIVWYARMGYRPAGHVQWPGKTYRSAILNKVL